MVDTTLQRELEAERSAAIRALLVRPFLSAAYDRDAFRTVLRHGDWLIDWFQTTCGWHLEIDGPGAFARLHKRRHDPDPTRPLRRLRGERAPFDRRRYELLCRLCAELISPPRTTLGLLAQQLVSATTDAPTPTFDTSLRRERSAFVDALAALADIGVITISQGNVDTFVDDREGNAMIETDVARLHQLLVTTVAPSRLAAETSTNTGTEIGPTGAGADAKTEAETIIAALAADPRYADPRHGGPGDDVTVTVTDEQRNRASRQLLARRLLDDPAVHRDELTDDQAAYLGTPSGRQWLQQRLADAGLTLEVRAEGLLAVDETATATDLCFPGPEGNVWQVALLLVDRFVADSGDRRQLVPRSRIDLTGTVADLLRRHPSWGKKYRAEGGAELLGAEAVDVLVAFGLARIEGDLVVPRPAIGRYRAGTPVVTGSTLFDLGV